MIWPSSIMWIFVPNIADENFLPIIPTLEVASRQFQKLPRRRIFKHRDIFFSDIANRFVVGTV